MRTEYIDLNQIYPGEVLESKTYSIDKFSLSHEKVRWEQMYNFREPWLTRGLKADFEYVRLVKKGEGVMMSDTPMERNTNEAFIQRANGDVIIFGLGLGLVILPLLNKKEVTSILVVELYQDLIDIVEPVLKKYDFEDKLTIVQGDCFEFHNRMPKERKFDCVYGDIWISIDTDNYEEMKILTKNWKNRINRENQHSFIDHWMKKHLQNEIASSKRNRYGW